MFDRDLDRIIKVKRSSS